jgi:hypothetical protein
VNSVILLQSHPFPKIVQSFLRLLQCLVIPHYYSALGRSVILQNDQAWSRARGVGGSARLHHGRAGDSGLGRGRAGLSQPRRGTVPSSAGGHARGAWLGRFARSVGSSDASLVHIYMGIFIKVVENLCRYTL